MSSFPSFQTSFNFPNIANDIVVNNAQKAENLNKEIYEQAKGISCSNFSKEFDLLNSQNTSPTFLETIKALYDKTTECLRKKSKPTIIAISVSAVLTAPLIVAAATVAAVAFSTFFAVSLVIATVKLFLQNRAQKNKRFVTIINDLKLAGIISSKESKDLKEALNNSTRYQSICSHILSRIETYEKPILEKEQRDKLRKLFEKERLHSFYSLIQKCLHFVKKPSIENKNDPSNPTTHAFSSINDTAKEFVKNLYVPVDSSGEKNPKVLKLKESLIADCEKNKKINFKKHLLSYSKCMNAHYKNNTDNIKRWLSEESTNRIKSFATYDVFINFNRMMREQALFDEKDNFLEKLGNSLFEIYETNEKNNSDVNKQKLLEQLENTEHAINELYTSYNHLLGDYSQKTDNYQYSFYFGNFNQKFKAINDILGHLMYSLDPSKHTQHKHNYCNGCHFEILSHFKKQHFPLVPGKEFEYEVVKKGSDGKIKKEIVKKAKVLNSQYVSVVRGRLQLEAKIKEQKIDLFHQLLSFFQRIDIAAVDKNAFNKFIDGIKKINASEIDLLTHENQYQKLLKNPTEKPDDQTFKELNDKILSIKTNILNDKLEILPFAQYLFQHYQTSFNVNKQHLPSTSSLIEDNENIINAIETIKQMENNVSSMKKMEANSIDELSKKSDELGKKSILLATCSFGTGHKAVAEGIAKKIGAAGGHVSVIDPTEDVLLDVDPFHKLGKLFNRDWRATKIFQWVLTNQHYWFTNAENRADRFIRKILGISGKNGIAPQAKGRDSRVKELIRQRILKERPDMLVTTYHMDLNPFLEVCEEMGIPLLHIPTDLDVKAWEPFGTKSPTYNHFKTTLPLANDKVKETARPIQDHQIVAKGEKGGIPIRPELYTEYSEDELLQYKLEQGIDPDAKVVLVLSGGNGQKVPFPDDLANSTDDGKKYHVIVIGGGNNSFGDYLKKKIKDYWNGIKKDPKKAEKRNSKASNQNSQTQTQVAAEIKEKQNYYKGTNQNVKIQVAEDPSAATKDKKYYIGANELSKLLAIADCAITKPGGVTVAELLDTGVPILADRRKTPFNWEDTNIKMIEEAGRGKRCTTTKNLLKQVAEVCSLGRKKRENQSILDVIITEISKMILEGDKDTKLVSQRPRKLVFKNRTKKDRVLSTAAA